MSIESDHAAAAPDRSGEPVPDAAATQGSARRGRPDTHPATAAVRLMPSRPGPAAHPALPQPQLDVIHIHRLHVRGFHGVHDHERAEGQDFYIDADVWIDTRAAAASDDVADTLHYGHLMIALADIAGGEPVDLLETLAERLAAVTLAFAGPQAVRITVHKPQAPVNLDFEDVTVSILRFRPDDDGPVSTATGVGTPDQDARVGDPEAHGDDRNGEPT